MAGEVKTIGPFLGYIMMINMCLGTGFLGVPFSFFYAGYLAAIPTLLFVAFLSWLNCSWLLEVMARAQAMESLKTNTDDSDEDSRLPVGQAVLSANIPQRRTIDFRITMDRKFEMVELCEIFGAKWFKYVYLICFSIICFVGTWAFSTVAGSAWASNIPFNFAGMSVCDDEAFHHKVLPVDEPGCLRAYCFSLFLFGIIVVTLSLLDLRELAIVQLFMGLLRFITVGAIVLYSIVNAIKGGDGCLALAENEEYSYNASSIPFDAATIYNGTLYTSYKDIVVKFNPIGWLETFAVFSYAFIIHFGVASLTHPVKEKKYLRWMVVGMFLTALICYMSLGVVTPLWFKASVQETVTLNFLPVSTPGHHLGIRILAYYLIYFPSLDVMSAYPLVVHVLVNNIYIIITGKDTSEKGKWRFDWLMRMLLRLVGSVTPILAAMGLANLIYVIKYGGLFGYIVCYFFPAILQVMSVRKCLRTFRNTQEVVFVAPPPPKKDRSGSYVYNASGEGDETAPLVGHQWMSHDRSYMTPYSIPILSHPIFVSIMTVFLVVIFGMIFGSLFVKASPMQCDLD